MLFEQQTSRLASLVQTSISVRMCTTMISDISGMCGTIELSEIRRFIRPLEQGSERKTVRDYVNCLKAESYYCERVLKKAMHKNCRPSKWSTTIWRMKTWGGVDRERKNSIQLGELQNVLKRAQTMGMFGPRIHFKNHQCGEELSRQILEHHWSCTAVLHRSRHHQAAMQTTRVERMDYHLHNGAKLPNLFTTYIPNNYLNGSLNN